VLLATLAAAGSDGGESALNAIFGVALLSIGLGIVAVLVGTVLLFPDRTRKAGGIVLIIGGLMLVLPFVGCLVAVGVIGQMNS
jgi:hypothetical protein